MTGALQPNLPRVTDGMVRQMRDYQTRMGEIQDASVLHSSLEKYLRIHQDEVTDAAAVRSALERREAALISAFLREADELFAFAPPDRQPPARKLRPGTKPASR